MTQYYSIHNAIKSFSNDDIPIFIPVFEQVSYAKHMVSQLTGLGISNFVLCDNASTYAPMQRYLEEVSKEHRVCYLGYNFGPRVYSEKELLPDMPEWYVVTDPDLIFNKNLPLTFIQDMIETCSYYQFAKVGFALDIWGEASNKFFNPHQVRRWEERYWDVPCGRTNDGSMIYHAPIDTTFAMHNSGIALDELNRGANTTGMRAARIAGNYTCEHMGWWANQPLDPEEFAYYKSVQVWASTENEKKRMGYA